MTRTVNQHVLGHAAVEAETAAEGTVTSRRQLVLAVRVHSHHAARAGAAAPGTLHCHGLALAEALDALAELVDPAGVFVAQGKRGAPGEHAVAQHVHEVKVGVAGTGAGDLDDDLAGAGRGDGDLGDDGIAVPGLEL